MITTMKDRVKIFLLTVAMVPLSFVFSLGIAGTNHHAMTSSRTLSVCYSTLTKEETATTFYPKQQQQQQNASSRKGVVAILQPYSKSNKRISKVQLEFQNMIMDFANYKQYDIDYVSNSRLRTLYEGVKRGARNDKVVHAFTILYQDFTPCRFAGRVIYKQLKSIMSRSQQQRLQYETSMVQEHEHYSTTTLQTVRLGRKVFNRLIDTTSTQDEEEIPIHQLEKKLTQYEFYNNNWIRTLQQEAGASRSSLNFEKFMKEFINGGNGNIDLLKNVFHYILATTTVEKKNKLLTTDKRNSKKQQLYSDQFDTMVRNFGQWEDRIVMISTSSRRGRMLDVLRGCFEGAKDETIMKALKIVYMDYSALRIAGNLIYSIMGRLVKMELKRLKP